jgi:Carbohydrate family 9 binding domain-like
MIRTNGIFRVAVLLLGSFHWVVADAQTIQSKWADGDAPPDTNPASTFWRRSPSISMDSDPHGKADPKYRSEVRSRWTRKYLYLLFICPYEELYLKPDPVRATETNELWKWDVAEAFIGSDFQHIRQYKEFEISPQGEWVDLDIDLDHHRPEGGWKWNSGFAVSARIDTDARVWFGAIKIPFAAIDTRPPAAGNVLRINLFRSQGPPSARHEIAWQATMSDSFHVPERFGTLTLVK